MARLAVYRRSPQALAEAEARSREAEARSRIFDLTLGRFSRPPATAEELATRQPKGALSRSTAGSGNQTFSRGY